MPTAETNLFATVPGKDHLSFFPKGSDNPDCEGVVDFLEFKKSDVSKATGVRLSSVRYDERIPPELRKRVREWAILVNLVADHFNGDSGKTHLWFSMPNPLLGNMSPRDMIRFDRFRKLLGFVLDSVSRKRQGA
jgi:uncharacterized protein (DUF2384 family)